MNIKVGFGNDIHRLIESRPLIIGGVQIPFHKGEDAHSDGDVLIHSLCDALLGALALKDIGYHFPNNDPNLKNIDSRKLLTKVVSMIKNKGYKINNVDSTVVIEKPKLKPFIEQIRKSLADIIEIDIDNISVKAKTNEGLGDIGHSNAVEAYCVVTLIQT